MATHLTERDEPLLTFLPQHESHTPETLKQRKPANAVQFRVVAQHERQSVTGDSAAQMMNVMNPNIGREPAQQAWQGVVRAAVKRHVLQIPGSVAGPFGILELVLDVEQPDTGRGRQQYDRQMNEQERTDPNQPYHRGDDRRDRDIRRHGTEPGPPATAHEADR